MAYLFKISPWEMAFILIVLDNWNGSYFKDYNKKNQSIWDTKILYLMCAIVTGRDSNGLDAVSARIITMITPV